MNCPTCGQPWPQRAEPVPDASCPHCRAGDPAVMNDEWGAWVHLAEDGTFVAYCIDEGAADGA